MKMINTETQVEFASDVDSGLSTYPKKLSSKYFYNDQGDKLFQQIMAMPSYYVTDAEIEILKTHGKSIARAMNTNGHLNIFELGAGDGTKTILFLESLEELNIDYTYYPIDISADVLQTCENNVRDRFSDAKVEGVNLSYDDALDSLLLTEDSTNLVMFLGSNLGNLYHKEAITFLEKISRSLNANDYLLMGLDSMKDPEVILEAYNDKEGITKAFNLNLLTRINEELGGNFNTENYKHWPVYDPESGTTTSYLVSTVEQEVHVAALNKTYKFDKWESIHTEISQKYDETTIEWLCQMSGLSLHSIYSNEKNEFFECLIKKR